jgi:hypothetical protein
VSVVASDRPCPLFNVVNFAATSNLIAIQSTKKIYA